ncbi:MAG TPA: M36 family metallopeptidase [Acidobacteriota bacterium]|nr:M36 family metallopeptidase [Acidobacteriota bacterium]
MTPNYIGKTRLGILLSGLMLLPWGVAPHGQSAAQGGKNLEPLPVVHQPIDEQAQAQLLAQLGVSVSEQTERRARIQKLRQRLPQAQVEWSALTGNPHHVFSYVGALTAPNPTQSPETIARTFLRLTPELYQSPSVDLQPETLHLVRSYQTRRTGVTHLTFQQYAGGIPILGGAIRANVLPDGRLLSLSGDLFQLKTINSDLLKTLKQQPGTRNPEPGTRIFQTTLESLNLTDENQLRAPLKASQVLLPIGKDTLRLAWQVEVQPIDSADHWLVLIDAERHQVLRTYNLTWYAAQTPTPQGRVFATTPQPNLPRVTPPPPGLVEREMRPFAGDPVASPDGWIDLTQRTTVGNNVEAQEDRDANNTGGFRPVLSDEMLFDFPLVLQNPTQGPEQFQAAAVTNAFYWANVMHDYLYALGFDEAAGNFQRDNFGRGGVGNDPVRVDAQDGARINNSSFATSPDGAPGQMSLYFWTRAVPSLDSSLDAEIILHEYTHGLTNRLVGGPQDVTALNPVQSSGMGEGWSDWFALSILTRAEDPVDGAFPFGSYVAQNFERGLRRFAYSTNLQINPLTFADIDPAQTRFPDDPTQVHKVGEVWCSALWEVRANFIGRYGFEAGRRELEHLVVEGLKLTPTAPTMLDARDAILLADRIANQGQNQDIIWRGFAKRGMGFTARAFGGGLMTVRQAFDLPPFADPTGRIVLNDVIFADGEPLQISVGKASFAQTESVTVEVRSTAGDVETLVLDQADAIPALFEGVLPVKIGQPVTASDGILQAQIGNDLTVALVNPPDGQPLSTTAKAGQRIAVFTDTLESGIGRWKPKNTWALTTISANSATHSWTDSPQGNYPAKANLILTAPKFDLTQVRGAKLTFWHQFDLERGFDFGFVEAKAGAGTPWQILAVFTGNQLSFQPVTIDLSQFDGKKPKVRFRLTSDTINQRDGWYIDDVKVLGGSDGAKKPEPEAKPDPETIEIPSDTPNK